MSNSDLIQRAKAILDQLDDANNLQEIPLGALSTLANRMRAMADQIDTYTAGQLASVANNEMDRLAEKPA